MARAAAPRAVAERSVRVSTLELFFDLVFVFTITQLTGVLVDGEGLSALVQVVVMLLLIWWMYDGYAWLTNAIATDRLRFRLLLVGGMGGFLVIALAIPDAYDGDGLAFGVGYLVVVLLHGGMFVRGTSVSEVRAILRIAPFNLLAVALVLAGGAVGGDTQWMLWGLTGVLLWVTPRITTVEGFVVSVSHFVERHGLVVIVALGESIVVIGAGAAGLPLDLGLALVASLALGLSAALWWAYFGDEEAVQRAFHETPSARRPQLALSGFGYWHYGILLGIVAVAAGLKKAIGVPYDPLEVPGRTRIAVSAGLDLVAPAGLDKGSLRRCLLWLRSPGSDVETIIWQLAGESKRGSTAPARSPSLVALKIPLRRPQGCVRIGQFREEGRWTCPTESSGRLSTAWCSARCFCLLSLAASPASTAIAPSG